MSTATDSPFEITSDIDVSSQDPTIDNPYGLDIKLSSNGSTYWLPPYQELKSMVEEFANEDLLPQAGAYETSTSDSFDAALNDSLISYIDKNVTTNSNVTSSTHIGWTDITLASIFCCIIAGTLIGNTLVIAAVATTRRLRTVTNCFVMSLAVADWFVGMFVMPPKVMLHFIDDWPFGTVGCDLWISLDILLCTASILSLCAISIDRYLAITRPLAYSRKRRSKRLALSMISCVWVAAVVITSPPHLGWYDEKSENDNSTLTSTEATLTSTEVPPPPPPSSSSSSQVVECEYSKNEGYVIYSALGSFFLPLFVMLYVYARIACVIARRQRTIQKLHKSSSNEKKFFDSEDVGDDVVHQLPGSTLNKHSSLNLSSSSLTLWNCIRLKRFPCKSKEHKHDTKSKRGSNLSDVVEPLQAQTPNPATLLSLSKCDDSSSVKGESGSSGGGGGVCSRLMQLGGKKGSTKATSKNSTTQQHNNGGSSCSALATNTNGDLDEAACNALLLTSSTNLTRLRTGSRLCHHSLANLSPQKSMGRRVQTSFSKVSTSVTGSTTAGSTYADNINDATSSGHLRKTLTTPTSTSNSKIWTIEDDQDGDEHTKHSKPALVATPSEERGVEHDMDDTKFGEREENIMYGSLKKFLPTATRGRAILSKSNPKSKNNHCNHNNFNCLHSKPSNTPSSASTTLMSASTGMGGSTGALPTSPSHPSKQPRSKSVKLSLNFNLSEQNQSSNSKEFSSGRIASFKRETKTAQTLAAVVGGFIICWLPFFVVYILSPFVEEGTFSETLVEFFVWLAFYSADFRSAFWRLTFHRCEGIVRAARSPDRNSPKRCDDPQAQMQLRATAPP